MDRCLKRIKYYSRSLTVRVVFVMFLLVIPLNIWGIFTVSRMQEYMYTEARSSLYSVGQLKMGDLDARMSFADIYLADTLLNENAFFSAVLTPKNDISFYHAAYNIHDSLQSRASLGNDADGYFLYAKDYDYGDVVFDRQQSFHQDTIRAGLDTMIGEGDYEIARQWVLVSYEGEMWLMRCMHHRDVYYGAFIDVHKVFDEIYESSGFETIGLEMTAGHEVWAGEDGHKVQMLDREDKVITACSCERADMVLYISLDKREITQNLPLLQRAGIAISITFCLVLPLIIFFLYQWLLKPVKTLLGAMNAVQEGDLDYQIKEKVKSNEFGSLYDNFNHMITAQVEMNKEILEKETYARKMELQTLQLQIRPHFLLNFLNLLYGLVVSKKQESSQKLILYLSDYFRYIFRSGKDMEFYEKEINLIINYIDVARLRYPFILFEEEHDESVLQVEVPPLLIHNFIENVLKHGLKVKGMTAIRLSASYRDGIAEFVIADDGRGIAPEEVKSINEGRFENEGSTVHVGLQNSWRRIKYFYGDNAILNVESVLDEGTKVTICVPYDISKKEENGE